MTIFSDMSALDAASDGLKGLMPELDSARSHAAAQFKISGLPTRRSEAWRYTDLKALRQDRGTPVVSDGDINLPMDIMPGSTRLVFNNGKYVEASSRIGVLPDGVRISRLGNFLAANPCRIDDFTPGDDGVSNLNLALLSDGIVLSVAAGVTMSRPIEIIHCDSEDHALGGHVRHRIELGEGAEVTVIERWMTGSGAWSNVVIDARVPENATLHHHRITGDAAAGTVTGLSHVDVDNGGHYACTCLMLGGETVRFENAVRLMGEDASAHVDGLSLARGRQSHDCVNRITHGVPNTGSEQVYRAVGDERATTSFAGKVIVVKDAQQTEADQDFKAMILDRRSTANAKPELEILADDVIASHGATIGELDSDALFYLISRGISPVEARAMLIEAFAGAVLARIAMEDLRDQVTASIGAWMLDQKTHLSDTAVPNTGVEDA